MSELQILVVINGLDLGLALGHVVVVVDVIGQQTLLLEFSHGGLHHLVEDVVGSLNLLLEGDSRLLQEISLNVASSKFSFDVEVDANKLSLNAMFV